MTKQAELAHLFRALKAPAAARALPALAERAWTEKLTRKEIKKAIVNWRPDHWRV